MGYERTTCLSWADKNSQKNGGNRWWRGNVFQSSYIEWMKKVKVSLKSFLRLLLTNECACSKNVCIIQSERFSFDYEWNCCRTLDEFGLERKCLAIWAIRTELFMLLRCVRCFRDWVGICEDRELIYCKVCLAHA